MKHKSQNGIVMRLTEHHNIFHDNEYVVTLKCSHPKKPQKYCYIKYLISQGDYYALTVGASLEIPSHWKFLKDATIEWQIIDWLCTKSETVALDIGWAIVVFIVIFCAYTVVTKG